MFAPFLAIVLTEIETRIAVATGSLLLICCLPWVFYSESRPLLGENSVLITPRQAQYFANDPGFIFSYTSSVDVIAQTGCQQVGIILGGDTWEYPLWALLERDHPWKGRMEHVKVDNMTKGIKYPLGSFEPCQVIVIGGGFLDVLSLGPVNYKLTNVYGREDKQVRVFSKEGMISPVKPFESR